MTRIALALAVLSVTLAPGDAQADARHSLDGITHNYVLPTGELLAPGEFTWTQQIVSALLTASVGIAPGLEVQLMAPPAPLGGQVQVRAGLLPRSSRGRLVLGVGIAGSLINGARAFTTTSMTAAYSHRGFNIHGTIMAYQHAGGRARVGVLTAGVTWRVHPNAALMADATRFSMPETSCRPDIHGREQCQTKVASTRAITVGVKLMGTRVGVDAGLILLQAMDYIPLPMISILH